MVKLSGGPGWSLGPSEEPQKRPVNPQSPSPKCRLEKRMGKAVTVIAGLHTYGSSRLESIARELKTRFGVGGTVKNGCIEIQGDHVEAVRAWFKKP